MSNLIEIPLGMLTKVFLIRGESGAVLVDAGNPHQSDLILAALEVHGIAPTDIKLILLTHGHTDHFGSARALREATGAPVAIHAADVEALRLGANPEAWSQPTGALLALLIRLGIRFPAAGEEAIFEPDITFTEAWRLDEYGVAGEVLPAPGHTPGSSVVLLDSGAAILGDLLSARALTRKPAPPLVAWDLARNWESVREVLARAPQRLHITHGRALAPTRVQDFLAHQTATAPGGGWWGKLLRYHDQRDAALLDSISHPDRSRARLTRLMHYRAGLTVGLVLCAALFGGAFFFLPAFETYSLYLLTLSGLGYLGVDLQIKLLKALVDEELN